MKVSSIITAVGAASAVLVGNAVAADFGAPQPPPFPPPAPIVYAPVNYHCMRWTEKCDRRWGFGAPRFYRCMWRHGC